MKGIELTKAYDPKGFEDRIYSLWKSGELLNLKMPGREKMEAGRPKASLMLTLSLPRM